MKPIKLKTWQITLPMYPPDEVSDNSSNSGYAMCPRYGLYETGLRRAPTGINFPIQFGLGYHKYRETVEDLMLEMDSDLTDMIHKIAVDLACKDFIQPPAEHKHSHNNLLRLTQSCELARDRVRREREQGKILVTKSEDSFDLELPFVICMKCGHTYLWQDDDPWDEDVFCCDKCGHDTGRALRIDTIASATFLGLSPRLLGPSIMISAFFISPLLFQYSLREL